MFHGQVKYRFGWMPMGAFLDDFGMLVEEERMDVADVPGDLAS